jgi:ubiquinone biosynthesis protein UbiJ
MMPVSRVFITALENAANRYLSLDPESTQKLTELAGKIIRLHIDEADFSLYILIEDHGLRLLERFDGGCDAVISAPPLALLRSLRGDNDAARQIHIQGDMHTARELQHLLARLDIDWEEQLSKIVGDIPAHQIGNLVRAGFDWGRRATHKFQLDVSEYIQYELTLLPPRHAIEHFLSEVDTLRSDLDRLEARIRRLRRVT